MIPVVFRAGRCPSKKYSGLTVIYNLFNAFITFTANSMEEKARRFGIKIPWTELFHTEQVYPVFYDTIYAPTLKDRALRIYIGLPLFLLLFLEFLMVCHSCLP